MWLVQKNILFLAIFHLLFVFVKSEISKFQNRDFQENYILEEERRHDYQPYSYPPNYQYQQHLSPDCAGQEKSTMLPLIGKGMQFLLIKLGMLGIFKAISSLLFVGFLAKLPLILIKLAFLKSFFLPFIAAPLFTYLFAKQMDSQADDPMSHDSTNSTEPYPMSSMPLDMGRQLTDNITSIAWQSMKMLAESDQCLERISCMIGSTNEDSNTGNLFSRILKLLHYKTPSHIQDKLKSIRNAFIKGSRTLTCSEEEYKCYSPELVVQHGTRKIKVL